MYSFNTTHSVNTPARHLPTQERNLQYNPTPTTVHVTCVQPLSDLPAAELCLCASHRSLLIAQRNGI